MDRQIDREIDRQVDRQIDSQIDRQIGKQVDVQYYREILLSSQIDSVYIQITCSLSRFNTCQQQDVNNTSLSELASLPGCEYYITTTVFATLLNIASKTADIEISRYKQPLEYKSPTPWHRGNQRSKTPETTRNMPTVHCDKGHRSSPCTLHFPPKSPSCSHSCIHTPAVDILVNAVNSPSQVKPGYDVYFVKHLSTFIVPLNSD